MKDRLKEKWDQLEATIWGSPPMAGSGKGPRIRVVIADAGGVTRHVGDLDQEGGEFVFRYAPSYASAPDAQTIVSFPDLHRVYRSRTLFPFFTVRLPPTQRADVQRVLGMMGIPTDDTMQILGKLAKKSIANPYELQIVEA